MLSPILFSAHVDDLSHTLCSSGLGCTVSTLYVNHLFYADDLVLMSPSAKGLQALIDLCVDYSITHSISFNPKKTVCLSFIPRCLNICATPPIVLDGRDIAYQPSCKYLGVFISSDTTDDADLSRQLRSLYVRVNSLSRNFKACSNDVKALLFTSFCSNVYAGHCWSNFKKSSMSKLVIAFNNCFRRLMSYRKSCSASAMYVSNNVRSMPELLRKAIYSFRERILHSNNTLVLTISSASCFYSALWCHWNCTLFTFAS